MSDSATSRVRLFRFGPFELNVRAGELRKHGTRVRLREQSFQILLMLLENPGDIVLREDIRQRLWPNNTIVEFDHSINTAINRLRTALGETSERPCYIETVGSRGYRFAGEAGASITPAPPAESAAPQQAPAVDPDHLGGRTFGHYKILHELGNGGMGVVFRAEDLRLGRQVALKFLPAEVAADPVARLRFEREARAASAMNHPNICTVYDVGEWEGRLYLGMELIEGVTLEARLAEGPLSRSQALSFGIQICSALEAAHRRGIVHRDIKPANVMIIGAGERATVKVLDFGLAEAQCAEDPDANVSSPGTLLGTLQYMSPEQVQGMEADARSDIFSFGLVLYHMLTGRRAFEKLGRADLIAAIQKQEPQWGELPADLERTVRKCLAKDPDGRWQSAADLRDELEWLSRESGAGRRKPRFHRDTPRTARATRYRGLAVAAAAGILAIAAALYVGTHGRWPRPASSASAIEDLQITQLMSTGTALAPAISPDGKYVAYVQWDNNAYSLWMRQIDTASQVQIVPPDQDTIISGATVTPDGGFVEFLRASPTAVHQELWRVPFLGGTPKKLLDSFVSAAGWSPDGRHMAFLRKPEQSPDESNALIVADADGNHERQVTVRRPPAAFPFYGSRPAWSPDGRVVAVYGSDSPGGVPTQQLVVVDAATGAERALPVRLSLVTALGPSWLDAGSLVVTGAVEDGAPNQIWRLSYPGGRLSRLTNDLSNYGGVSLTADRDALVTGRSDSRAGVWVGDGSGARGAEVVPLAPTSYAGLAWARDRLLHDTLANGHASIAAVTGPAMSDEIVTRGKRPAATADGRTVVFLSTESGDRAGLWKVDIDGRHAVQLVSGKASWPVVTPDGKSVIFVSHRSGPQRLWIVSIDGGPPALLGDVFGYYPDVSPDGKSVVFGASNTRGELGICDLPGCTNLRKVTTPKGGPISRWTPDGRGIAFYDVGRGGNLWVQPLDGSPRRQITHFADNRIITDFAWSRDGTRLAIARSTVTNDVVLFRGLRR